MSEETNEKTCHLWKLRENLGPQEREAVKQGIKSSLEALNGKIAGVQVRVSIDALPGSTADVMLETLAAEEAAFAAYAALPEHRQAAAEKIRPYVQSKLVFDAETE